MSEAKDLTPAQRSVREAERIEDDARRAEFIENGTAHPMSDEEIAELLKGVGPSAPKNDITFMRLVATIREQDKVIEAWDKVGVTLIKEVGRLRAKAGGAS